MTNFQKIFTVLLAVSVLILDLNASLAQSIIVDSDTYCIYYYSKPYYFPEGYTLIDASVGQYIEDPQEGNKITSTVMINVDSEKQKDNPVLSWNLYINNELVTEVSIFTILGNNNSKRKDINYYASIPFEGTIESAWLIPISSAGDEITDERIIVYPFSVNDDLEENSFQN